jgi:hypothetical protein
MARILIVAGVVARQPTIFLRAAGKVEVMHFQDMNERTKMQEVAFLVNHF